MGNKIILRVAGAIFAIFLVQSLFAQSTDTAQIVISKINMPQLGRERTIRIYLPAGYATSKRKYPVIYMHDGQNLFTGNTSFAGSWLIDSTLKTFPADKQAIVVGIDNSGQYRMAEYNAYTSKYASKPDGDAYLAFMVNTLKPHIDSLYRTKKDAKHTAIAGSSMGGLISMYAAVKYPDVFGVAGVFSPSFWIAPQMYPLTADSKLKRKQRFFLACGDQEGDETVYVNKMDSVLIAKGFNRKKVPAPLIMKGAKHNEAQWKVAFKVFYQWFAD